MATLFHYITSTTTTISLILLFLSPLTTANSPVLDTDGNPLQPGSRYYVLTSGRGAAGRGGLAAGPPLTCPPYVFQFGWWNELGTPITIIPSNSSAKEITIGMDVGIAFGINAYCRNILSAWKLTSLNNIFLISTDGSPGDPNSSNEAFLSTFQIREVSDGSYKFVYCFVAPSVGPPSPPQCDQLIPKFSSPSLGGSFLSLGPIDEPLPFFGFVFSKVEDGGTATTS